MTTAGLIVGGLSLGDFKSQVASGFDPPPMEDPIEWLPAHVRFPSGSEETNFDFDEAPYCRGVVQRFWKDHRRRKANLCWGVRLGKTSLLLSLMAWQAVNNPCPMGLLFPDNDILESGVDDHVYPMFDATPVVRCQLPPVHQRNKRVIRFRDCRARLASAGKKSSVSGYPAKVIGKIEHEKCGTRKSSEADPSARMDSRADGYPLGVKILEEGSPSDKTTSRVAVMLDNPDVMKLHFHVPCPHCGAHDRLEWENVVWDADENTGRKTAASARKTARYVCPHCDGEIHDHQRREMIQKGVWAADGETVDKRGRVRGTAVADDADEMVFVLSSLYSLRIRGWGSLASEYVKAKRAADQGKVGLLQKFWNEKLARIWDPLMRRTKPHKIAQRLSCKDHADACKLPEWTSFLTFTSDVGKIAEELVFYWMVIAWGSPFTVPRGGVIDWGSSEGKGDFVKEWRELSYPLSNGTSIPLWGQPAAVDSGDFTIEIYDLVRPIRGAWPLKGDSRKKSVDTYSLGYARAGLSKRQQQRKTKAGHPDLFEPSSNVTQSWRQSLVEGRISSVEPWFVSLPADVCGSNWETYRDFFEELSNDQFIDGKWEGDENEYGDTLRYGRALAEWYVHKNHRGDWASLPAIASPPKQQASNVRRRGKRKTERFV